MTGFEVAVGLLIAWVARKAGRVARKADGLIDSALDAGVDRVHELVMAKLTDDPALRQLEIEASASGEVGSRTQARVRLALEEAAEQDPVFKDELEAAVDKARPADGGISTGTVGVVVNGNVSACGSSIALGGVTNSSISFGQQPDPSGPVRE